MIGIDTTFLVQLEVLEMPDHDRARDLLQQKAIDAREQLALAPQTLAEFIHVITDGRRFAHPLGMSKAIEKANLWWNAAEVYRVYPTAQSTQLFLEWVRKYQLGRKRLLDTQLASLFHSAGIKRIFTSNARGFAIFNEFEIISP